MSVSVAITTWNVAGSLQFQSLPTDNAELRNLLLRGGDVDIDDSSTTECPLVHGMAAAASDQTLEEYVFGFS